MSSPDDIQAHVLSLQRFATGLTGNPTDAEDLVQECLRRVLSHLDRNRSIHNLRAFLFKSLRNAFIDHCRRRNSRGEEQSVDQSRVEQLSIPPNQEDRLLCLDIVKALDKLPEDQREVVLLVCLEDMAYEDVADITDSPIGTVRSRLHRGRAALRELLEPSPGGYGYGRSGGGPARQES